MACDVECDADEDCDGLGAELICHDQRCRSAVDLGAVSTAAPLGSWRFDESGGITISDPERRAFGGPVTVRWMGDHFLVAMSTTPWPDSEDQVSRLAVARISGAGIDAIWTRVVPDASVNLLAIADDGRIALNPWPESRDSCPIRILPPRFEGGEHDFDLPCDVEFQEGGIGLAPIPGSTDWLAAYFVGPPEFIGQGDVVLGRYDVFANDWTLPARTIGARSGANSLDMLRVADDVVVVWGDDNTSQAKRVVNFAAAAPAPEDAEPTPIVAGVLRNASYGLAALAGQPIAFGLDGRIVWSAALSAGAARLNANIVAGTTDRGTPGVAAAEELQRIGVCYATVADADNIEPGEQGIAFALVDPNGVRVGDPVILASGLDQPVGCDVAWSGEYFLAAWWEASSWSPISVIRGRRIDPISMASD